jgi:hypothetical protein
LLSDELVDPNAAPVACSAAEVETPASGDGLVDAHGTVNAETQVALACG